jgi:hypothetical protein
MASSLHVVAILLAFGLFSGCERTTHGRSVLKASHPSLNSSSSPISKPAGAPPLVAIDSGVRNQCSGSGPSLPVAALSIEWQEEETPRSMVLRAGGEVLQGNAIVARLLGRCLLDARGRILASVDEKGDVRDKTQQRIGRFQAMKKRQGASELPWGTAEVYVSQDGSINAVTDDGAVFYAQPGEDPISMPAGVTGPVAGARRTALLLLDLRCGLHP